MYCCTMKKYIRFIYIMTAVLAIASSCEKKPVPPQGPNIVGSWELTDIQYTKSAQIGDQKVEVTLTFQADGSFEMKQMLGQGRVSEYSGTWALDGDVLSGKYSDNKSWGASYSVVADDKTLTMTPVAEKTPETYIYKRL